MSRPLSSFLSTRLSFGSRSTSRKRSHWRRAAVVVRLETEAERRVEQVLEQVLAGQAVALELAAHQLVALLRPVRDLEGVAFDASWRLPARSGEVRAGDAGVEHLGLQVAAGHQNFVALRCIVRHNWRPCVQGGARRLAFFTLCSL